MYEKSHVHCIMTQKSTVKFVNITEKLMTLQLPLQFSWTDRLRLWRNCNVISGTTFKCLKTLGRQLGLISFAGICSIQC
jgi:hypothetical protein